MICIKIDKPMSHYLFSQFKANEFERLHRELSEVFDIQQASLQSLYDVMWAEFEIEGSRQHLLPRSIFRSDDLSFQKRYDEALVIGIDLPSILERDDGVLEKKTVVILGQDPLRKSSERKEEVLVGTPYSVHERSSREKGRSSFYFDLIKVLLDEGYRIYLTDIYKICVSKPSGSQCTSLSNQDRNRFFNVLRAELEVFAPLAIITLGVKAGDMVTSLNLNIRHLPFPHPSHSANKAWIKLIGKSPTNENKIEYWQQTVSNYLAML
jgi:hypothetical protein